MEEGTPAPATVTSADSSAEENVGQKIVAGGSWRVLAFAFASLLGIVMTAVVSRQLGPADFALFTTSMSLVTIALSLSDVGLLSLGIREYAALPQQERDRSQRTLIALRLITSAITSTAIVIFAILKGYPTDLVWGLVAAGVGICSLSLCISYTVPLQATYRLGQVAALEAGRQALQMTLMIIFAYIFAEVGWLMVAILPTGIVLAFAAAMMSRKLAPITPSFNWRQMRLLLAAAGTFALTAAIGSNYAFVAQIVSNSVMSAHESGMFSLAFRIFIVGVAAFSAAAGGAFALLVTAVKDDDRERLIVATRRLTQASLLAGVGSAVALIAGAQLAVKLLGGPEFDDAVSAVALVAVAFPGSYVVIVLGMNLLADEHYKSLVLRSASGALVSIAATAVLADQYGAVGAAAGIIVGEYALALLYATRLAEARHGALPKAAWLFGAVAAGAIACAAALLPIPSLARVIVAGVVYLVLILAFKLIPPELLHPIRRRFGFGAGDDEDSQ